MKKLSTLFSTLRSKIKAVRIPEDCRPAAKTIVLNLLSISCAIAAAITLIWGMIHWMDVRQENAYARAVHEQGPAVVTIGNTTHIQLNPPILDKRNHRYSKIELMEIIHRFETNNSLRIVSWQEDHGQNIAGFEMQIGLDLVHQPASQPALSLAFGNLESRENKKAR